MFYLYILHGYFLVKLFLLLTHIQKPNDIFIFIMSYILLLFVLVSALEYFYLSFLDIKRLHILPTYLLEDFNYELLFITLFEQSPD
nr:MAG TPA: hypothetical protein [Bacteriophage sp.]